MGFQGILQGPIAGLYESQSASDGRKNQVGLAQRRQINKRHAVWKVVGQSLGDLDCQARLAHPARSGQRDELDVLPAH